MILVDPSGYILWLPELVYELNFDMPLQIQITKFIEPICGNVIATNRDRFPHEVTEKRRRVCTQRALNKIAEDLYSYLEWNGERYIVKNTKPGRQVRHPFSEYVPPQVPWRNYFVCVYRLVIVAIARM